MRVFISLLFILSQATKTDLEEKNLQLQRTNKVLKQALQTLNSEAEVAGDNCGENLFWDGKECLACERYDTIEKCRWVSTSPLGSTAVKNCADTCVTHWVVGKAGERKSCDAICEDQDLICSRKGLEIATKSELSSVCKEVAGWSGTARGTRAIRPHTNTETKACYGYDLWDKHPASCSAVPTDSKYARICACRECL